MRGWGIGSQPNLRSTLAAIAGQIARKLIAGHQEIPLKREFDADPVFADSPPASQLQAQQKTH